MKPVFVLILLQLFLQGCSSIINGTTQKVTITSNVQGAEVSLNGVPLGRTPITTRIKRESKSFLMVKKEGYKDYQQQLQTKLDPWFWGNILIGGVLGSTTDAASGSTHLLDPETIFVQMEPSDAAQALSSENSDLKSFVIASYVNLVKDIKRGKGDYLESILKQLKTSSDDKAKTIKQLQSMVELYDSVHEFAEEIIKYQNKK